MPDPQPTTGSRAAKGSVLDCVCGVGPNDNCPVHGKYVQEAERRGNATPERASTICYHRHRRSSVDIFSTTAITKIECLDCGASVEVGYNAPIPDLPPMPVDAGHCRVESDRTVGHDMDATEGGADA